MAEFNHFEVSLSVVCHTPDAMMAMADRFKTVAQGLALDGHEATLRLEPWRVHEHDGDEAEDAPEPR